MKEISCVSDENCNGALNGKLAELYFSLKFDEVVNEATKLCNSGSLMQTVFC